MKRIFRNLIFPVLIIYSSIQVSAQEKSAYIARGGMTIGFGLGPSYQQSDVANSTGGGFDFSLGSHLYKKDNAFLAVDWKFRFLAGRNYAHDHRINTDNTFTNVRYDFFNYDFELGLNLNRLRERTRIVITPFLGVGITHGMVSTDLYDASGKLYDYSVINTNQSKSQIYNDLIKLTDGKYETSIVNTAAVLPTSGIFVGYQFSHSFSMGIEHKTNFSLTESNSFYVINIDNKIKPGSPVDMNHYTTLAFKWNLGRRYTRQTQNT